MHYYQFNIGDYVKSTRHLSPIEDIAYRRLLDLYYDTEKPLILDVDKLTRLIGLKDHKTETQQILSEFFSETKKGYIQKRVQRELDKYSAKAAAARENGKLGGRPKKTQPVNSANPDLTQSKAKQETLTTNHKPLTKKHKPRTNNQEPKDKYIYTSWPEKPEKQIFDDWIAMRKRKKAAISQTVINSFGKELHKAVNQGISVNECMTECVTRNWTGFKAEWIKNGSGQVLNQWMKDEININTFEAEILEDIK